MLALGRKFSLWKVNEQMAKTYFDHNTIDSGGSGRGEQQSRANSGGCEALHDGEVVRITMDLLMLTR